MALRGIDCNCGTIIFTSLFLF